MFPSIDNEKGINAVQNILDHRNLKKPSTECVLEGLRICLCNNN